MRSAEQARLAVLAVFADWSLEIQLIDDLTEVFEAGWVFRYQSAKYLQTGDSRYMLAGNAPIFVPRNGAPPVSISYHRPTIESIEAFNSCGDANGEPNPEVEVAGGADEETRLECFRVLRQSSPWGMVELKQVFDRCLAGHAVRVEAHSVAGARELAAKLRSLRFDAKVTYRPRAKA